MDAALLVFDAADGLQSALQVASLLLLERDSPQSIDLIRGPWLRLSWQRGGTRQSAWKVADLRLQNGEPGPCMVLAVLAGQRSDFQLQGFLQTACCRRFVPGLGLCNGDLFE